MNEENIIPHQFSSQQSREEAAKNGRAGGIASGEARRQAALFRKFLAMPASDTNDSELGDGATQADEIVLNLIRAAKSKSGKDRVKAAELVYKMIGELSERLNISTGIDEAETLAKLMKEADI
jgi:hypothetical protein